ncbi:MAG: MBL fold metallo-hydrolase [Niabella sp.]
MTRKAPNRISFFVFNTFLHLPPHNLQITFLGTGTSSGVPMIGCGCEVCTSTNPKDKRLRSSILIESDNTTIVVDAGPDFRQQMLLHNVKKLDAIIFTHSHKDHIAGLDDVRAYNYFQKKPMQVYGTAFTLKRITEEFNYAFAEDKYPGIPSIQLNVINKEPFVVGDVKVISIPVWHFQMPVMGYRFENFTYITDANRIEPSSQEKIKGSDVLVLNALRHQKHISHFTLPEAVAIADELDIPVAYFTHISHQLGLHYTVNDQLPAKRQLAYDGLKIIL